MKNKNYITRFRDLRQLKEVYSGQENPSIWVLPDNTDDYEQAIKPSCVFIDDDGDIIIQIDGKVFNKVYKKGEQNGNI